MRCHEMSWDVIVQWKLFQCLSNKWSSKRWIQNCPWCQDWGGCQGRNKDRPDKFIEKYRSAMAARRSILSLTFQPFSLSAYTRHKSLVSLPENLPGYIEGKGISLAIPELISWPLESLPARHNRGPFGSAAKMLADCVQQKAIHQAGLGIFHEGYTDRIWQRTKKDANSDSQDPGPSGPSGPSVLPSCYSKSRSQFQNHGRCPVPGGACKDACCEHWGYLQWRPLPAATGSAMKHDGTCSNL